MSKDKISDYSATANSNTDIGGINIDEGCAPSGINDAIRTLMKQLKDFQTGAAGDPVTVGDVLTIKGASINDTNGNELFKLTATASAVNELTVANAATGGSPTISATGGDTNIGINLTPKGTGGVVFPAGAVGTPSITTSGDLNTGVYFPAADTVGVTTGGTERVRVDSSGNVGIGTSSPTAQLDVYVNANTVAYQTYVRNVNAGSSAYAISGWGNNSNTNAGQIAIASSTNTTYGGGGDFIFLANTGDMTLRTTTAKPMTFYTNATERARIDSSGNLLVGGASSSGNGERFYAKGAASDTTYSGIFANSSGSILFGARNDGALLAPNLGSTTGTALIITAGNLIQKSSSSIRYKKDVEPIDIGLDFVLGLNPVKYNLKNGDIPQVGFIAEEFPDTRLVSESMVDPQDETKGLQREGVNYANLVAPLVKAIQEQQAIIQQLQADVAALKAA